MATFYDEIKRLFDENGALCPTLFAELHMGDPPDDVNYPFCVIVTGDEPKTSGSFGSVYHEDSFAFHIADRTQESVASHVAAIEEAFQDAESSLTVAGRTVIAMDRQSTRYAQVEPDLWEGVIEYEALYQEVR